MDPVKFQERSANLRKMAFLSVALSTVAVVSCLLAFPVVFNYIQTLQSEVDQDVAYCKMRTRDLYRQNLDIVRGSSAGPGHLAKLVGQLQTVDPESAEAAHTLIRTARQSFFGSDMFCCTCHRGEAGRAGSPGGDGSPGADGLNGTPGNPGQPAPNVEVRPNFPPQCPCEADSGPGGPPGLKGPPGLPGGPGAEGQDAENGQDGRPGPKGQPGQSGQPGGKGNRGEPGTQRTETGRPGTPGPQGGPGNSGRPGTPGKRGKDGNPGQRGSIGEPGRRGNDGRNGNNGRRGRPGREGVIGSCDHCPAARLAPGY